MSQRERVKQTTVGQKRKEWRKTKAEVEHKYDDEERSVDPRARLLQADIETPKEE